MALTTRQAFDQFMIDISITEYQKTSIVEARRKSVIENLTAAFPESSDLPFVEGRLIGSAAKGTIVRPLDDIDVLATFSNVKNAWSRYRWDSKSFLYRIRNAYNGIETAQVGARGQAIRVFFQSGGHVDVAPVFIESDDVFQLPNGTGGWIKTSPFVANRWFRDKNAELDYNLAPLVRLLKKWNGTHSKRLRSFHLETMAGHTFSALSSNRRTALQKFFEWGGGHIDVWDPGQQAGSLSTYLTWSARDEVKKSLNAASDRAVRALDAEGKDDHEEAKRLWRLILGSTFPN